MSRRGARDDGPEHGVPDDVWDALHEAAEADDGEAWADPDDAAHYDTETERQWRREPGIFVISPVHGAAGERIRALQQRYDPKLARLSRPHVTIIGSSGVGPVVSGTTLDELRECLTPIAASFAPLELRFGAPVRFLQTNIVSLPLDPNGPVRRLFEAIRASGLRFLPTRFSFTPHATVSFFPTLTRARERELTALRVADPVVIDRLVVSATDDPQPPRPLLELPLLGAG